MDACVDNGEDPELCSLDYTESGSYPGSLTDARMSISNTSGNYIMTLDTL